MYSTVGLTPLLLWICYSATLWGFVTSVCDQRLVQHGPAIYKWLLSCFAGQPCANRLHNHPPHQTFLFFINTLKYKFNKAELFKNCTVLYNKLMLFYTFNTTQLLFVYILSLIYFINNYWMTIMYLAHKIRRKST